MTDVTDINMYSDGGTVTFHIGGSALDGNYRLQSPFHDVSEPLFRDGTRLDAGGETEVAIFEILKSWVLDTLEKAGELPDESEGIPTRIIWLQRMSGAKGMQHVIKRLEARCVMGG